MPHFSPSVQGNKQKSAQVNNNQEGESDVLFSTGGMALEWPGSVRERERSRQGQVSSLSSTKGINGDFSFANILSAG